jgi:hypothetical protein
VISIAVADRWQRSPRPRTGCTPYTPDVTARASTTIIATVQDVFPGITIRNTATDTGTVGTAQAWTSARTGRAYATDGGIEAYFAPDGALVIRDAPADHRHPAWTIKTGAGGSLKALTRTRPLDRLFNTVVLTPATADARRRGRRSSRRSPTRANPRHPDRIGVRPYPYASPTALTEAQAQAVAGQVLARITGTTETLDLSALAMPALEGGDVVRVLTPSDVGRRASSRHFLQQHTIDFASGDMTANTRSDTELAA